MEAFLQLRRGWDYPVPNGETLKDVYARSVPFFQEKICPILLDGKSVLLVAHGNSLRALEKYLENIPDNEVASISIGVAGIHVYELSPEAKLFSKEVRGGDAHL